MKKYIYTLFFFALFSFNSFSQANPSDNGPGFGEEGSGDAQTNPTPTDIPISQNIDLVLLSGVLLGAYFVYNNRKGLSKN